MTAPQRIPTPARHYRLATFGTTALAGPGDDTVLGTHGRHRRRLALLSVLAAAGERGRSRDQLFLLFWPDATQARARHSLDQLLYALRGSLGECVFASVNPVRLNPDVVSSDVATFSAALDHDDLDAAAAVYRGPFLDGFYLADTPEFGRWVDTERSRLASSYSIALERMARKAEAAGDDTAAVHWWRRLTELDPVSSESAARLVGALTRSGDNVAALRYAERFEAIVAQELGTSVGPAFASVIFDVRAATRAESVTAPRASASPVVGASLDAPATPSAADRAPNDRPAPAPARPRRRAAYVIGTLAAAVVAVLIATAANVRTTPRDALTPTSRERSIAVLPLANVSHDPKDAPLVDGLGEELIGVLAKRRGVRVTARTSATAFRNSDTDVRRIGDSLGVDYVVEGGVQKAGSRLRVQLRLVDTRNGSTRWSETYDRELRDLFALQSEIAEAVARELDATLGGNALASGRRGPTPNIAAYELYLRGNDPATTRGDSATRAGLEYFRQAIAIDSEYAAAYAGFARLMLTRVSFFEDTTMSRRHGLAVAEQAARKAIMLDSTLAEAHGALAVVRWSRLDVAGSEVEIKRAVALDPTNSRFREWLVQNYVWTGRPTEALAEARRAVALDPLSPNVNAELAHALLANDRCDEALAQLAKLRSLQPPLLRAGDFAARCYGRKRMWAEAIVEAQRGAARAGLRRQGLLGFLFARAGRTAEARRVLASVLDRARRTEGHAFDVATIYAGLGAKDEAFSWLDKALEERAMVLDNLDMVLDALAPDPRIDTVRRRLGLRKG